MTLSLLRPLFRPLARALAAKGWELTHTPSRDAAALADLSEADRAVFARVAPYTLTGLDRRASLLLTVGHLVQHRIPGAIVECGVWRGGSTMAVALALMARGDTGRDLYLHDTFEGISEPTEADLSHTCEAASAQLQRTARGEGVWREAGLEDVQINLWSTGYRRERIHFVKGRVEQTNPATLPHQIALLRLDTDWYESTGHELLHLYPLLAPRGVLIINDYGHWQGARQAVDEYFADATPPVFLHRVDYTPRLRVKPA